MHSLFGILLLIFIGYSFSILLLPEGMRKYSFFLSPFIGAIMIIVISLAMSAARIGMNEQLFIGYKSNGLKGFQFIILVSIISWIYILIFHAKQTVRFHRHDFIIIFLLALSLLPTSFFPFHQSEILKMAKILQETSLFDMVQDAGVLSKINIQIGTPLLYSFFLSLSQTIPSYPLLFLAHILSFGSVGIILLLIFFNDKNVTITPYNTTLVLISLSCVAFASLNKDLFFFLLIVISIYLLYKSFVKKTIVYIFALIKIVFLVFFINPFFIGLLIRIYLSS